MTSIKIKNKNYSEMKSYPIKIKLTLVSTRLSK